MELLDSVVFSLVQTAKEFDRIRLGCVGLG
jgi:hypothetical protein